MIDEQMTEDDGAAYWNDPSTDPAHATLVAALETMGVTDTDRRTGLAIVAGAASSPSMVRPRRNRSWVAAAAACVIMVGAVLVATLVGGEDGVVVAAGDGVAVVADDGTTTDIEVGDEIADGSVLIVTGFVDVGDGPVGPGRYVVDDGQLVPDGAPLVVAPSTSTTRPQNATPGPGTPSTSTPRTSTPRTSPLPAVVATTTVSAPDVDGDDTGRPAATTPPSVTTTVPERDSTPSSDTRPEPATTPVPTRAPSTAGPATTTRPITETSAPVRTTVAPAPSTTTQRTTEPVRLSTTTTTLGGRRGSDR